MLAEEGVTGDPRGRLDRSHDHAGMNRSAATSRRLASSLGPSQLRLRGVSRRECARRKTGWPSRCPAGERQQARLPRLGLEYSPFLRGLILDDPARLAALLAADPKASLKRIVDAAGSAWKAEDQAGADAASPSRPAGAGAADGARRSRRGVGRGRGDRGADRLRRCGGRRGGALRARRGGSARADRTARREGPGTRLGLDHPRHGQARRAASSTIPATSISSCSSSRRRAKLPEDAEPSVLFVRLTKKLVQHPAGAHRRRLCLPHRPPPEARSRRDQHRDLDRRGAPLLREPRARTGSAPR